MDRVLLVGNGFNLVSDGGTSWNALLNKLAGATETEHEEEIRKAKPFTLWFEEIRSKSRRQGLKEFVSSSLKKGLSPNGHHADVMALDFENILTTNYDYNLEQATGQHWVTSYPALETYHSLFRRRSLEDRHIWHIHGELSNTRSIMLGHEQYSKYIHKIRSYLTTGVETKAKMRKGRPYLSKFARKKVRGSEYVETWVDLFLEHEVHIVGFSFDYTENHLWNLLMEKQQLRAKGESVGKVVFHRCSDKNQSTSDEAKLSILSAFDVEVIDHTSGSYSEAYDKCIRGLR